MLTRVLTSIIGIPVVIGIIVAGNPLLKYVVLALSLIATYEFYQAIQFKHKPIRLIGYVASIVYYITFEWVGGHYTIYVALNIIIALIILVITYPKYSILDIAIVLFPIFYITLLFSFIILLREVKDGLFWVWLIAISAWGSDTFAYFVGKTLGKHKLAPKLSPKKTVEGSIGGIIGAGILACIYTLIYTQFAFSHLKLQIGWVVLITIIGASISQLGDLSASAIKRYFNQKDYGNILPGHGGILDRFDSFLFIAPIIYILVEGVQRLLG